MSDIVNVRYSPTLFLAFGPQRPTRPIERSAVVTARMNQRGDSDLSKLEFEELVKQLPDAIQYDTPIRVPSNYLASLFDQLLVWSEIRSVKNAPLAMSPMQIDQGKLGVSIESWMALPWAGPEHLILPGFHSDGGAGLRGKLNGNDLFLTSIGLMAAGTRTALISRWATGGKTSLTLTGKFAVKQGTLGPEKAIMESRQETRETVLDYENEPRLRMKKTDPVLNAEHPFFWAGPMLLGIPDNRPPAAKEPENQPKDEAIGEPAKPVAEKELDAKVEPDLPDKGVDGDQEKLLKSA